MENKLVPVDKYSENIMQLSICKRVSVDYPLLCREIVAKKLAKVCEKLPSNLKLQVDSAYRTRDTQQILYNKRQEHLPGLVFNPSEGIPPHCTGGAVDISLLDENNIEVNLSAPFEKFYDERKLYSDKITKEAQDLRLLLNGAMLGENFAPTEREYWHFSYGDKSWADYYKTEVLFDEVELAGNNYFPQYKIIYFKLMRKIWKFVNYLLNIQTNY